MWRLRGEKRTWRFVAACFGDHYRLTSLTVSSSRLGWWQLRLFLKGLAEQTAVIVTMDNNSNGDLDDESVPDTLKPPPRSKSRTKSVDELVAHLEEQNRWVFTRQDCCDLLHYFLVWIKWQEFKRCVTD